MDRAFFLSSAFVFDVTGMHSERYLNARLSNDIRSLQIGKSCLAAALSAQGRVEGFFSVSRVEKERFILLCDGGNQEEVKSALTRFVVADRVAFNPLYENLKVLHVIGDTTVKEGPYFTFPRIRGPKAGIDVLGEKETIEKLVETLALTLISENERHILRIKASIPSFPEEINAKTLFAEASFKEAVSFTKGCYVGQEVMEKIDSHGRTESMLIPYEVKSTNVESGSSISIDGDSVGKIISVYKNEQNGESFGFARVKRREDISNAKLQSGDTVFLRGNLTQKVEGSSEY